MFVVDQNKNENPPCSPEGFVRIRSRSNLCDMDVIIGGIEGYLSYYSHKTEHNLVMKQKTNFKDLI